MEPEVRRVETVQQGILGTEAEEHLAVIRLLLPDRTAINTLVAQGIDLCESVQQTGGGYAVDAVVTAAELACLEAAGFELAEVLWIHADWRTRTAERKAAMDFEHGVTSSVDQIKVSGACCVPAQSGALLHVKARTSAGEVPSVILTANWDSGPGTARGSGGTAHLARLSRQGEYEGHWLRIPVSVPPDRVVVRSGLGGSTEVAVASRRRSPAWGAGEAPYVQDFISHYMDPTELSNRVEALAREFPDLTEIVAMPYETDGYRRPAQAVLGGAPDAAVVVTTRAWGHEGGNGLAIVLAGPESPGQPLSVAIDGRRIAVRLGADGVGQPNSTAAQVAEALNQGAGHLVVAQTYRGSAGTGIMSPLPDTLLSDHLSAPPAIARAPFRMRALRIGRHRDGSRPGVLIYAQEHAREWVTPLITIEVAERLLRNDAQDPETRLLIDGVDLFLIPCANPDGAHFSFYDYGMQRKNMVYHTGAGHAQHSDPGLRNFWGTDPNRNYGAGSVFDGYRGASTNCISQIYAGSAKLSEAESRNLIWLVDQYSHIRFATNLHSFGGYIMWPPGAARAEGEGGLAHLTPEQEALFNLGAERMAEAIKQRRGTVIPADQIGTGVDVMYSSAGNSADHLWYFKGIFAWSLEVGVERPDSHGEPRPVGFQPDFPEGRTEALEFADGLVALLRLVQERGMGASTPSGR